MGYFLWFGIVREKWQNMRLSRFLDSEPVSPPPPPRPEFRKMVLESSAIKGTDAQERTGYAGPFFGKIAYCSFKQAEHLDTLG